MHFPCARYMEISKCMCGRIGYTLNDRSRNGKLKESQDHSNDHIFAQRHTLIFLLISIITIIAGNIFHVFSLSLSLATPFALALQSFFLSFPSISPFVLVVWKRISSGSSSSLCRRLSRHKFLSCVFFLMLLLFNPVRCPLTLQLEEKSLGINIPLGLGVSLSTTFFVLLLPLQNKYIETQRNTFYYLHHFIHLEPVSTTHSVHINQQQLIQTH